MELAVALVAVSAMSAPAPGTDRICVDTYQRGADVSPGMYGIFFEEINHAGDGGLYAEMIQNRGFEEHVLPSGAKLENGYAVTHAINYAEGRDLDNQRIPWDIETLKYTAWSFESNGCTLTHDVIASEQPLHPNTPHSLRLVISGSTSGAAASVINSGYWGVAVKSGASYRLRFYLRTADYDGDVVAKIYDPESGKTAGQYTAKVSASGQWTEYTGEIQSNHTTNCADFRLEFSGNGTVEIDYVSLFPCDTYKGRDNGLRADIAELLEGLRPQFMRWPGGCIVEGISLPNRVQWKETLGDPMTRRGEYSLWGYRSTWGMGYHEFLQMCEDMGMSGMFVGNAGFACAFRSGDYRGDEAGWEPYYHDIRDAIEYAIGDPATNVWAAKRASAGHPEPFPLKYVEIGNENFGPIYARAFDYMYKKLKAEYPQITFICNLGLGDTLLSDGTIERTDMIDPHWYVAPSYFYNNVGLFDNIERGHYDVYVGEYACNDNVGSGNMDAALSEVSFMMSMERNSDLVKMASYAPLIENSNARNWSCNLIWQKNDQSFGRASYYVQKMFGENVPSYNIKTQCQTNRSAYFYHGRIGLGTYQTSAKFRNLKVKSSDGKTELYSADLQHNQSEWTVVDNRGTWTFDDGVLTQSDRTVENSMILVNHLSFRGGTIEFKACKTGGNEGFFVYFGVDKDGVDHYYQLNIGGWGNTATALQEFNGSWYPEVSARAATKIETDRWYDVKIEMTSGNRIVCYLDGEVLLTYAVADTAPGRTQAISGYDETAGEVVIKVLNAESEPWTTTLRINAENIAESGLATTLSASTLYEENTFDEPTLISPETTTISGLGPMTDYTFKPYSFTVLRVKATPASTAMTMQDFSPDETPETITPKPTDAVGLAKMRLEHKISYARQCHVAGANGASELQSAISTASSVADSGSDAIDLYSAAETSLDQAIADYIKSLVKYGEECSERIASATFDNNVVKGWRGMAPSPEHEVAEFFNCPFSMYQTVDGLENGYYLLSMQGFYRDGSYPGVITKHEARTENLAAMLAANESMTNVCSVCDHRLGYGYDGYCNNRDDANRAFSASPDNFINAAVAQVTDGTLRILLRKEKVTANDWCCFDNFRLYRIHADQSATDDVQADESTSDAPIYDLQGRRMPSRASLQPGVYVQDGKKRLIK